MTEPVAVSAVSQLAQWIAERMGLHFPPERHRDLERGIRSAARELGCKDMESCMQWLLSSPLDRSQVEILASHLTVGETYFFREKRAFEFLKEQILPRLTGDRRSQDRFLRIWSAGCATGEEPYSVAIALRQVIADLSDWNVTLLATDINPHFLRKAEKGIYTHWSFRETPAGIRETYFRETRQEGYEILPEIRRMVTFSYLNLGENSYPSLWSNTNAMDVVFCRNVLMYLAPAMAQQVVDRLYRSLAEGGWLLVSPSEASHILFSQFTAVNIPGAILYRKESGHAAPSRVFLNQLPEGLAPSFPPPVAFDVQEPLAEAGPEPWELPALEPEISVVADREPSLYQQALPLYRQGRYLEAREKLLGWLSQKPEDREAMELLARVDANCGRLTEALVWCEKAIAADRLNEGCHYLQAVILQELGATEEARKAFQRTLYLNPNFALVHVAWGNLARLEGKREEASKHFRNALSLLEQQRQDEAFLESEGITAGRMAEIIRAAYCSESSP